MNTKKKEQEQLFSRRELQIIYLICEALSNREISKLLRLSLRTVEGHRNNIVQKMKVHNTAGLVVYAIRHHLYVVE